MTEDALIIKEYREAFRKYAKDGIIDMDDRLKHKFNFQIHHLEDYIKGVQGIVPPHRQSQIFIVLVLDGTGEKTIGHFTFPIHKNLLFIVPERVVHSSQYWCPDPRGYFLSFNIEFFLQNAFPKHHIADKKIFRRSIRPWLNLAPDQTSKLQTIFEYLMEEYNGEKSRKNEMIAIKVLELIVLCDRFFTDAETLHHESIYNNVVEKFNDLIRKHYSKERSVSFYAKTLNIHPNHLNALVKKYTGLTAKETIDDYIVMEAKVLLHSSSLTIKEIGYELGFNSPDQFSSFFKKRLKLSPSHYKLHPN
jgi:AraC family transcriptional regulator, transcriptional activator of pobA